MSEFIQCKFCSTIVTLQRAAQLFEMYNNNRYRNVCCQCGAEACEPCWDQAFAQIELPDDEDAYGSACLRCKPKEWENERIFGVYYHLSFVDRYKKQFSRALVHPHSFDSQWFAIDTAIGSYLPKLLRSHVDEALSAEVSRAAAQEWAKMSANLQKQVAATPCVVVEVPIVQQPECSAKLIVNCFPLLRPVLLFDQ